MIADTSKFQKIFSALELPMHEDESLNYEALKELIEYELKLGAEGFYCMGSSGEGLLLTIEERMEALDAIVKYVAGRVPVIAHVGTIRTADAIKMAKHAQSLGIDAISMIPPYYYKFSMDEIIAYYEEVMAAVPGMPTIIYNIPQFTGVEFNKDNAGRLLSNPQVLGVKHTSSNLYSLERMKSFFPEKVYFNGFDEQFVGALAMGATATIGTTVNVFAPLFIKARDLFNAGDLKGAYEVQHQIGYYVEEMCKVGIFSAVKYLLEKFGIACGACRKPFHPLTDAEKAAMDKIAEEFKAYLEK